MRPCVRMAPALLSFAMLTATNLPVAADDTSMMVAKPAEQREFEKGDPRSVNKKLATGDLGVVPALASSSDTTEEEVKLRRGEVVTVFIEEGSTKFVVGKIYIHQPPSTVWPVLVNPFEFQNKICPRMKQVDVLVDQPELSVLHCVIHVCFLFPDISYTVQSKYKAESLVEFQRTDGFIKEFRGCWMLRELDDGATTEILYSMFIDPGIPVPRWIVREGVKSELPHTLIGLRDRVNEIVADRSAPVSRNIAASNLRRHAETPLASRKGSI